MKGLWTFLAISAISVPLYTMGSSAEARIIYSTEEGGTPTESFVIDIDDYAEDYITLQFGSDTANWFRYDIDGAQFQVSSDIDFGGHAARNMALHSGTTAERLGLSGVSEGMIYWDTQEDAVYVYNATTSSWVLIGGLNGADAATLDGIDSTQFVRSDQSDSITNNASLTIDSGSSLIGASGSSIDFDDATVSLDGVTNNTFILDEDNTGGDIALQFGRTLNETIRWDSVANRFVMSDNLAVQGSITQDGNTFTLDADNTGAGANVDIIASQGTDQPGTLRYNATTNRWEISNDGGSFAAVVDATSAQALTNKTIDGSVNTITNIDASAFAERSKTDTLTPEYANMTLTELNGSNVSSGNHKGTLSGDRDVASGHYYSWESKRTVLNDYTVAVAWAVPSDFTDWDATPLTVAYQTAVGTAADNAVDIVVKNAAGATLGSALGLTSTTWTTESIALSGAPTPGEVLTVHLTLKSRRAGGDTSGTPAHARIGNIVFNYMAR